MAVMIDLGAEKEIDRISLSFLGNQRHWIFLPTAITIATSVDGEHFTDHAGLANPAVYEDYTVNIKDDIFKFPQPLTARYIRITVRNLEKLPVWRAFKNRKPWIFSDEVMIN